jgi:hypothetical protein
VKHHWPGPAEQDRASDWPNWRRCPADRTRDLAEGASRDIPSPFAPAVNGHPTLTWTFESHQRFAGAGQAADTCDRGGVATNLPRMEGLARDLVRAGFTVASPPLNSAVDRFSSAAGVADLQAAIAAGVAAYRAGAVTR